MLSPKNPRYRTKEVLAKDLAYILNASVSHGTKYAVINNVCWKWTEFEGKKRGCRFWSREALANPEAKLIHEHVVPRKVVAKLLLELDAPTEKDVYSLLTRFAVAAVITKEEDRRLNCTFRAKMSGEFYDESSEYYHDPWVRYNLAGIEVVDTYQ